MNKHRVHWPGMLTLWASTLLAANAQPGPPRSWGDWRNWGDQGDGTYRNPVLPADYSDLDCIRVGADYYAISSTFQFSPGVVILHSKDLVNWTIAGHAVQDITQVGPDMNWDRMNRYGNGIWAGAIRFYKNKFWIYFGTPDEGYFMTTAVHPAGPWTPLHPLLREAGWDDCCPFWDDDGQGYFIGTNFKADYTTTLFKLAPDSRDILKDSGVVVNQGAGREANKLFKRNGWYYHFFSEDRGEEGRVVMMRRAKTIFGPYTEKKQLTRGNRAAHEPNQGGLVQTEKGDWYFFTHHGTMDWEGRPASLLPVTWRDGWPLIGEIGLDGLGRMTWSGRKPTANTQAAKLKIVVPQTSDDFHTPLLGPQWEWNYQPRAEKWSLTERPGFLRLRAFKPLQNDDLLKAGNTLTQRSFRAASNEAILKLDLAGMRDGQKAGLCHFVSNRYGALGVSQEGTVRWLEGKNNGQNTAGLALSGSALWLRSIWGLDGKSQFSYSLDGKHFLDFGAPYPLVGGGYRGDRVGIYSYNNKADAGFVDVDAFHYTFASPPNKTSKGARK